MQLCTCGFANDDTARACIACGSPLGNEGSAPADAGAPSPSPQHDAEGAPRTAPDLVLEDARTGAVVRATAPGGLLGRAGDFSPDIFSPRVSGVHAVVAANPEGRWTIEHTGRNESAVLRGSTWSPLRAGAPQPLFGGETLKLADMVFRVTLEVPAAGSISADATAATTPNAAPVAAAEAVTWSARCPVCGTEHAVADADGHVEVCSFCKDPLDARQIARVTARHLPTA